MPQAGESAGAEPWRCGQYKETDTHTEGLLESVGSLNAAGLQTQLDANLTTSTLKCPMIKPKHCL